METLRLFADLATTEEAMTFTGYGSVFGNLNSYGDTMAPGAFADTLAEMRRTGQFPAMLLQHGGMGFGAEDMMPIGIWTDLAEDGTGLRVTGKLADTPRGREVHTLMKMGALKGLSIGFIPKAWTPRSKPDEPRRTLTKVDLIEISPVTFPADSKAQVVTVHSALTVRHAEAALREAGFSRTEAKAIVAEGFKALAQQRDADGQDDNADAVDAARRLATRITGGRNA